jgi:transcription termination factor Rho
MPRKKTDSADVESKNSASTDKKVEDKKKTIKTRSSSKDSTNNKSTSNSKSNSKKDSHMSYFNGEALAIDGILQILPDYGVIRQEDVLDHEVTYGEMPVDVYISSSQIKRFNLRMGDRITGLARPPKENERYLSLLKLETVEGMKPDQARKRPRFEKLTPVYPKDWLRLENKKGTVITRLIDLVSPIGKGQRAMIVAPPKAGKTWILREVAQAFAENHPDVVVLICLIAERPEEVTHFQRSVKGEVYASNFDHDPKMQTMVAEFAVEKAKRIAETGKDVVILMDSLTRLARAYNMVVQPSGRTLSGGFDPSALSPAKKFFGAARCFDEGGSLTIIATSLVETGSKMDEVIFEEFKGTGNMELRLDRHLAEKRIFPAINIKASSTRHEELLYDTQTQDSINVLRRMISLLGDNESTELVIKRLKQTDSNQEFLSTLNK